MNINSLQLPNFKVLRINFTLQTPQEVVLPPFLGSTLRGAFGTALKNSICFVPHQNCDQCWFFEGCNYQFIFEAPNLLGLEREEIHPKLRGQKEFPQPFVLSSPSLNLKQKKTFRSGSVKNFNDDYRSHFLQAGENINFSITLFGKAVHLWAYTVLAVRLMANNGLGEKRFPFNLVQAVSHDRNGKTVTVFDNQTNALSGKFLSPTEISQILKYRVEELTNKLEKQAEINGKQRLSVEFRTPARIRKNGKITRQIAFYDLIKKLSERLEFLSFLYSEPSQKMDYRSILEDCKAFEIVKNNVQIYEFQQYQTSSDSKTQREILIGKIEYEGEDFAKFLPILISAEIIAAGSNTSYGFGTISIS